MNEPRLAVEKLETLAQLAMNARNEVERAAIYAAVTALASALDAESERAVKYVGENVERARWHISAIVGYDVTNGHPNDQHLTGALAAIAALRGAWPPEA